MLTREVSFAFENGDRQVRSASRVPIGDGAHSVGWGHNLGLYGVSIPQPEFNLYRIVSAGCVDLDNLVPAISQNVVSN